MTTRSKFIATIAVGCCLAVSVGLIVHAADQSKDPSIQPQSAVTAVAPVPIWFPRVARMMHLSADQRAKLVQLRDGAKAQVKAIRADATLSDDQKRAKVRETVHTALAQAGAVLTPEQRQKLQKIQRMVTQAGIQTLKRRQFMRNHPYLGYAPYGRFGAMPGGPMQPMARQGGAGPWQRPWGGPRAQGRFGPAGRQAPANGLFGAAIQQRMRNLTPEQRQKMAALMKDFREKAHDIMAPAAKPAAPAPAAPPAAQ